MKLPMLLLSLTSFVAFAQHPAPPAPPPTPGNAPQAPLPPMAPEPFFHGPPGIPAAVAAKLGIPQDTVKKVRDASLDAQDALITLEADLKRAQLDLERALGQPNPDESAVFVRLETIAKAELQVRKNRVGLMLKVRKLVGNDTWEKLQAELPLDPMVGHAHTREVRVIRDANGTEHTEVNEHP